ncbi:MAG TPA: BamA/TamA family outer membrane protein [Adhaeribacter sp.]|nr:BamA/TamA family outer membrane protein [Adhaeribacter sp.]
MNKKKILLLMACAVGLLQSFAAAPADTVATAPRKNKLSLTPFPALFYAPENGFGFGALVVPVYNFGDDALTRSSSGQVLAYYTTKKQWSTQLSYNIYTNREDWVILGETRVENAPIFYYGTGNRNAEADRGLIDYKLFFTQNRILKQLKKNYFAGGQFQVNRTGRVEISPMEETGAPNLLTQRPGEELDGSTVAGVGPSFLFDSRDNVLNAYQGTYVELGAYLNRESIGSEFNFNRYAVDVRKYFSLDEKSRHVLALQGRGVMETGDVPFRELAWFGGHRNMRGYYEGRYRDKQMLITQAEYRLHFAKRHGVVLFGSAGQVAPKFSAFGLDRTKYSTGIGYRFMLNTNDRVNIRVDYAVSGSYGFFKGGASGLYFAIGESF